MAEPPAPEGVVAGGRWVAVVEVGALAGFVGGVAGALATAGVLAWQGHRAPSLRRPAPLR